MREFVYPARITPDGKDGGFLITFRDIPEAITQSASSADCTDAAAGALQAALEGRIMHDIEIPRASRTRANEYPISVPLQTALKVALCLEMREAAITRAILAYRLCLDEEEVRRMFDPHHPVRIDRLERALAVFGKQARLRLV
jgi:antitoxin HicB